MALTYYVVDPKGTKTEITAKQALSYSQGANSLAPGYSLTYDKPTSAPAAQPAVVDKPEEKKIIDNLAAKGYEPAVTAKENNYTLPSLPSKAASVASTQGLDLSTNVEKSLASQEQSRSSLVDFADALTRATDLARARRQEREMGILDEYGFEPGKVRTGTMGGILNLLEQTGGSRAADLQNAAIDAYKTEDQRKQTEKTNIQNLALQLLTSGDVDQTGVQAILGTQDVNSALSVAAGIMKSKDNNIQDIRTINNQLVKVMKDGTAEVIDIEGFASSGAGRGFSDTQIHKLGAAGLGDASYEEQVEYLYPPKDAPVDKAVALKQEFNDAEAFADQFTGSAGDLERTLRADSEYMTDGDIMSVVEKYEAKQKKTEREKVVKYDLAFGLIESNFNPAMLQTKGGELSDAVRDSLNDVDDTDIADYFDLKEDLTSEEERVLKQQLNKATITKNDDGTFTITIEGESRTYKKTGSGAGDITQV